MAKFLNKLAGAFIEEIPTNDGSSYEDYESEAYESESDVSASTEGVNNVNTLLIDIYTANNLNDLGQSIFKVEEVSNSLPKEMTTETKKNSVLGILSSFGLTAPLVIEDGESRIAVLKSVNDQITTECDKSIEEKEAAIEDLKRQIQEYECSISEDNERKKQTNELVSGEIDRIEKLVKFIGGVK